MSTEESLFIIDKSAEEDTQEDDIVEKLFPLFSSSKFSLLSNEEDDTNQYYGLPPPSVRIKDALEQCPIKVEYFKKPDVNEQKKGRFKDQLINALDDYLEEVQREKKHSFVTDGIETKNDISNLGMTDTQLKKFNRKEREKTKGSNWFNMKAPEMSEELKNELEVIQMRSALNPKHFYKRSEMKKLPKYFEMGKIVESSVEYHNSKNIRKRKKTLVDELLEDAEFQKFNKKKYKEAAAQKPINFKKFKKQNKVNKR